MKNGTLSILTGSMLLFYTLPGLADGNYAQGDTTVSRDTLAEKFLNYEDNEVCFKCHGGSLYEYINPNTEKHVRHMMPKERVLPRQKFYQSVHKKLGCTDCHSYDFNTFPHPAELIFEEIPLCIDCHGGDERFADYHFEENEKDVKLSVHYQRFDGDFTCWKCHDPHGYMPAVVRSKDINEIVHYDNNMCLSCHANTERFQLLTDDPRLNVVNIHSWLPNQALHFTKVRCIECHTPVNDTLLVVHQILPKSRAVRRCTECHSQNSMLMATLYKFRAKEQRKFGFMNSVIINESYVIGANRNEYLNTLSIFILAGTLLLIAIHAFLRILVKKKKT